MFAPSFFSGHLLKRFGAGALAVTGALLAAASALVSLHGTGLVHFYAALLALGIGWNFMYVAGTTLLARSYRPEERAATQATSEFATYAATATASLLAGQFLARWGWASVNLAVLPLLAVAVIVTLLWAAAERRARPAAVEARV
jgi:MFS family permease